MPGSNLLRPCPFCGQTLAFVETRAGTSLFFACCEECGAKGPPVDSVTAARQAWNDRAAPTAKSVPVLDTACDHFAAGAPTVTDGVCTICGRAVADEFYIVDARSVVGNCVSFWAPEGAGYTCNLDEAGLFTFAMVSRQRETDYAVPRSMAERLAVRHVRAEPLSRELVRSIPVAFERPRGKGRRA